MFGTRESIKILNSNEEGEGYSNVKTSKIEIDDEYDDEDDEEKLPFKERIIIDIDSTWKSVFDVTILVLVGYSCFTTLYYVAFGVPTNKWHLLWD